jgi:hypothetical protein
MGESMGRSDGETASDEALDDRIATSVTC